MKPILAFILLFIQNLSLAQSNCGNIDFEDGDTNSWTSSGMVSVANRSQEDPYGHFNLATSGYYSVQLGNKYVPATSSIKRQITVDNTTSYFIYSYAIVFLGYPHDSSKAAFVKLTVTDEQNEIVPCTELLEFAQTDQSEGFMQSSVQNEGNLSSECCFPIFYKPWTTVAIDLTPYMNQTLTFELSSSWCTYGVDWGYAYVDAYCPNNLIYEFTGCDQTHSIGAVEGFDNYYWNGPGIVSGQGTSQIEINQPGVYVLDIPNSDNQCSSVHLEIDASMNELPSFPDASFSAEDQCSGQPLALANTTTSVLPISTYNWYLGENEFIMPYSIDSSGEYQITLIVENIGGCADTIIDSITIKPSPTLSLGEDFTICEGSEAVLKAESSNNPVIWSTGEEATEIKTSTPGFYWASASLDGCLASDSILVDLRGGFLAEIPNVFTPDNDAINDFFEIQTKNTLSYELVILNRWGNVVFQTTNPQVFWDGFINNSMAEEGVYTYKLSYLFECTETLETKHGFVSLFRYH